MCFNPFNMARVIKDKFCLDIDMPRLFVTSTGSWMLQDRTENDDDDEDDDDWHWM